METNLIASMMNWWEDRMRNKRMTHKVSQIIEKYAEEELAWYEINITKFCFIPYWQDDSVCLSCRVCFAQEGMTRAFEINNIYLDEKTGKVLQADKPIFV